MIILLFSIASSQLIFDLKRDLHQTEYLITLEIDTQSKKNDFVVDTGAPYTSFICDQSSNQEKFKSLGCENVFSTYDGQWSCVINESHQIKIGNNSIDFNFGCVSNDATQILGMGNNNSFIKGLYDNSLVTSKNQIFSILLKQDKGILTIGQDYPNYEEVSIPINIYSQYYQVDLASIKDDKDSLNFQFNEINNYEIIIDSGSTLIVMDSELLQLFNKSFLKCETDPRGCPQQFQLLGKQCFLYDRTHYGDISNFFDTFPEFSFNFRNGYIFKLNAKDYLLKLNFYNYENFYCLPFIDFSRNYQTKYKKILLLGQPFMNNKEFYFDLTNQAIYVKNAEIQIEFTSKIFEHTTLYIQIGFLIGIYLFYRLYSTQIRGMLRGGLGNQGINAYG
ncbi:unnamed protein product [Paramecium sonneborni]|uniref:Peptidase A1 domain-containing protein n=1 Tax=Paramecium sonneborni TaxID=65129 RepID=A0A8S1KGH5_9CILI|nr:unnamed protein product [Paramecium sonneborni]